MNFGKVDDGTMLGLAFVVLALALLILTVLSVAWRSKALFLVFGILFITGLVILGATEVGKIGFESFMNEMEKENQK